MRCCLLLLICSSCFLWPAVSAQMMRALSMKAESEVLTAVRNQLTNLANDLPAGVVCPSCLMVGPQAQSQIVQGSVDRSQLQASIRAHGLPQEVSDRLQALIFARSVVFHTFSFVVNTMIGRGHYETFVGAGRRLDDTRVEFGVIRSVASAQLVAKTTPVARRNCNRRFFIKRCRSWTDYVARGLTVDELRLVESALRHFAIASASARLSSTFVSRRNRRFVDIDDADTTVASSAVTETLLDGDKNDNNSTLTELVRNGFDHLAISSSTQILRRIRVSNAGAFATAFVRSLRVPSALAAPLRDSVTNAVRADSDGRWRRFSVLFTTDDDPTAIKFVRVSLIRNSNSFDLASATVRLVIKFADRIQLLSSDDEGEIQMRRLPARITDDDLRRALRLLEAAAGRALGDRISGQTQ